MNLVPNLRALFADGGCLRDAIRDSFCEDIVLGAFVQLEGRFTNLRSTAIENEMTKQDAINKLKSLQRNDDCSNVHAEADTVLCDFLDARGYGEIAHEFRKLHEMYPTVAPRYSKPCWRL